MIRLNGVRKVEDMDCVFFNCVTPFLEVDELIGVCSFLCKDIPINVYKRIIKHFLVYQKYIKIQLNRILYNYRKRSYNYYYDHNCEQLTYTNIACHYFKKYRELLWIWEFKDVKGVKDVNGVKDVRDFYRLLTHNLKNRYSRRELVFDQRKIP